jgi:hypothetical protein
LLGVAEKREMLDTFQHSSVGDFFVLTPVVAVVEVAIEKGWRPSSI